MDMVFVLVKLLSVPQAFLCHNVFYQADWVMASWHLNCLGLWCSTLMTPLEPAGSVPSHSERTDSFVLTARTHLVMQ